MKPTDEKDSRYRAAYLAHALGQYSAEYTISSTRSPHVVAGLVLDMQRAARSAVTYETNRCSYPMTEAQEERAQRRIERLEAGINARLAAAWPGSPPVLSLGGDPRGPCARLKVPGQRGDGWNADDGFAVY